MKKYHNVLKKKLGAFRAFLSPDQVWSNSEVTKTYINKLQPLRFSHRKEEVLHVRIILV
jgi:hypothetical protein